MNLESQCNSIESERAKLSSHILSLACCSVLAHRVGVVGVLADFLPLKQEIEEKEEMNRLEEEMIHRMEELILYKERIIHRDEERIRYEQEDEEDIEDWREPCYYYLPEYKENDYPRPLQQPIMVDCKIRKRNREPVRFEQKYYQRLDVNLDTDDEYTQLTSSTWEFSDSYNCKKNSLMDNLLVGLDSKQHGKIKCLISDKFKRRSKEDLPDYDRLRRRRPFC